MSENLSTRLRRIRKKSKLSQADVAERIGISRRSYGLYELAKTTPDADKLRDIAKVFNISLDWLLTGHEAHLHQAAPKIPLIGLAECGLKGWYQPQDLEETASAPPDFLDPQGFAIVATGTSLVPEGVKPGFICYCSPTTPWQAGDIIYIEEKGGKAALKIFKEQDSEWLTVLGYLPPDEQGVQASYTERKNRSIISKIATVVCVKRKV